MMHRIAELLLYRLLRIVAAELPIFVDRAGDDADMQALRALRLAIDVEGEARLAAVAKPLLKAESVTLRLRDILAFFVEEHLVIESFGRLAAKDSSDLPGLDHAVDQVLAGHFIVAPKRDPARRPVDLPLELAGAAQCRLLDPATVFVVKGDQPRLGIDDGHGHLQHSPR